MFRYFVTGGGLASYGSDDIEMSKRGSTYADRVQRGRSRPTGRCNWRRKFELVIDLKTAKAMDLSIPEGLLAVADEVIE